jgi:hypothetical protein
MIDQALLDDFEATSRWCAELRAEVAANPTTGTQRGGLRLNPAARVLAQQQSHLRGLARLIAARKLTLPPDFDSELAGLLGDA